MIVVDNGSTDATMEVMDELQASHPNLRYVNESVIGLSQARNRGIAEATGNIVAFIDDDAEASFDWLETILQAIEADDVVAVGGRICLRWPGERPSWLPDSLDGYYSKFDPRFSTQRKINYPRYPYGTNMAIRRDVALKIGGFSTRLGRSGRSLRSGEEKEFFRQVHMRELNVVYAPDAVVLHHVMPERISPKWLVRRAFAQGRSDLIVRRLSDSTILRSVYFKMWLAHWLLSTLTAASFMGRLLSRGLRQPETIEALARMARHGGAGLEALNGVARGRLRR